jgi:flagellar protein FlaG
MDNSLSMSAGAAAIGAERVAPVAIPSDTKPKDFNLPNIQSIRDIKMAEAKGEHIPVSEEQLIKAIDRAIKAAAGPETTLEFSVHKQTNEIMVKVLNKDTGEVIREVPPEKMLDLVAKLWQMAGIFVDERR